MAKNAMTKVETAAPAIGFADNKGLEFMSKAMQEEYAGMEFQLDRVKFPSAGSTVFELPTEGENAEVMKEITGVIVLNHPAYAYYATAYKGGNNPPDCCSFDGRQGIGTPGGNCHDCPMNRYGTSTGKGQGKACKNRRMLYIIREGEYFPLMLSVPSGSLKTWQAYAKHHLAQLRKLSDVVTQITLRKATSSTGVIYSQMVFSTVRLLEPEEKAAIERASEQAKGYAAQFAMMAITPVADGGTGKNNAT